MSEQKTIFGREQICKAYGFGKTTFYWLKEKGAPIRMMGDRYFVHRDSLDDFIYRMTVDNVPEKNKEKEEPLNKKSIRNKE